MTGFVKIHREFMDSREGHNAYHLTPKELRAYIEIEQLKKLIDSKIYVIDLDSTLYIMDKPRLRFHRDVLEESIQTLCDKGIYTLIHKEKAFFILEENFTVLKGGFRKVDTIELKRVIRKVDNKDDLLYLYLTIRIKGDEGSRVTIAHQALANISQVNRRTVIRKLEILEALSLIAVHRSSTKGSKNKNVYHTLGQEASLEAGVTP